MTFYEDSSHPRYDGVLLGEWCPHVSMERTRLQLRGQEAWPWRSTMTTLTRRQLFTQRSSVKSQKTWILNNTAMRTLNLAIFHNSTVILKSDINIFIYSTMVCGIVTRLGIGWGGVRIPARARDLFSKTSKPAVRPAQPLSQCLQRFFPGCRVFGAWNWPLT